MSKEKPPSISAIPERQIIHLNKLATGSGVSYNNLWRFLSHERELSQREIDMLAAYLELRLLPVKQKSPGLGD